MRVTERILTNTFRAIHVLMYSNGKILGDGKFTFSILGECMGNWNLIHGDRHFAIIVIMEWPG